jgi:bifunctional non-homologous end joining protein LigD
MIRRRVEAACGDRCDPVSTPAPMSIGRVPAGAIKASLPTRVRLQICRAAAEPPAGDGWLHEIKHDGHRLVAILDGRGGLRLVSRNGYNRTKLFCAPFEGIIRFRRELVLDGEIAVPDGQGCTHLDDLTHALRANETHRLAFFAFDLLHYDGRDLRGCPIEERKAFLERVLKSASCPRVISVGHVISKGDRLFEMAKSTGCEGIVSKRLGSRYTGGPSRDWVKTKVSETASFTVIGYEAPAPGEIEALLVAERRDNAWSAAGRVPFGISKAMLEVLAPLRKGEAVRGRVTVAPEIEVRVRYFGRYRNGLIRDGVLLDRAPCGATVRARAP